MEPKWYFILIFSSVHSNLLVLLIVDLLLLKQVELKAFK